MRSIKLKNARLEKQLSHITELFYNDKIAGVAKRATDRVDNLIPEYHATSEEYLKKAFTFNLKEFGFPRALKGISIGDIQHFIPDSNYTVEISKFVTRASRFLGAQYNALVMYYPENGYIGWHHNGNAPGYNILMTHSQDGDGGFSFWDYKTKSITTIPDRIGWSVKVGYYPNIRTESNRVYWHMAKTKNPRISVAWVINQKEMWKNMIDEITGGDYDHEYILDQ